MDQNIPVRPTLLTVICILTFIGSGMSLFVNLTMFGFFDSFSTLYQEGAFNAFLLGDEQEEVLDLLFTTEPVYFLYQGLLYGLSVTGALFMWNLRKMGFHFYTMAQITLLISQQLFLPALPFPAFELLITALFVFFYARHLSIMH